MSEVVLYADPVCPFAWLTYRWLTEAMPDTHALRLRPMSLAVLNEGREVAPAQRRRIEDSRVVGRVLTVIEDQQAAAVFHAAVGRRVHEQGVPVEAPLLRAALGEARLPADLASAARSADHDAALRALHQASQDALGEPGGSPITTIGGRTFFGPVLTELPAPADGRALFAALTAAAAVPGFAELRRSRDGAPTMPKG
ncbi:mycothiol-dependent nitroreductase Rv2466c family protein [Amycolatopsis echigonensis]|uniref:Disulfide bond formation protein DsbA n=1 Tax=Amycolatopsis echigonensis TaxID=2576905 RepID=A0A8E2B9S8_9PSEU|nr:disulfide bond formation protein DsbA [Amycolatopsis echigonensis]MBB2505727.1 disulfide bond formation protein DsbA [Amycolatopsis echigonensis]